MPVLFEIQNTLMFLIGVALLVAKGFALVDAFSHTDREFLAADKQGRQFWLIVLGLTFVAQILIWNPLSLLNLVGTVGAFVYLADTRPALRAVSGNR